MNIRADLIQSLVTQAVMIDGDEPLGSGTENDGLFGSPAVRITVPDRLLFDQCPCQPNHFDDFRIGCKDLHSNHFRRSLVRKSA